MNILDFLPIYPDIEDEDFNDKIYRKREFYDNRLQATEEFPKDKGSQTKYQRTISRFLSSKTPYTGLLLMHDPGSGKTCSAVGAIELNRKEKSNFNGAIIIAKGDSLLNNFRNEIIFKCTEGGYIPRDYDDLKEKTKVHRVNASVRDFYTFETFETFAGRLENMKDSTIAEHYSNKIIVIDEVHNLRIHEAEKKSANIYNEMFRLTHNITNFKIILLSGTPMKDNIAEIGSVMNLILPKDKLLKTGVEFNNAYLNNDVLNEFGKSELKKAFKGRVSVLKELLDVEKTFSESKEYATEILKHFKVRPLKMSSHQTRTYMTALEADKKDANFSNNSIQASLFVFPDGSYGTEGFNKYIKKHKGGDFSLVHTNEFKRIKDYSVMYHDVIKVCKDSDSGCVFLYNSSVSGGGCILLAELLKQNGFEQYKKGDLTTKTNRFVLLTGDTSNIPNYLKQFNDKKNWNGDYIKVIIGSVAVSEGYSFNNIRNTCVLTPHWNYTETMQAIARGIRFGSHKEWMNNNNGAKPTVVIHQYVPFPDVEPTSKSDVEPTSKSDVEPTSKSDVEKGLSLEKSIFLRMYKLSEDKDVLIKSAMRIMIENAFDCALNYVRNKKEVDYSANCEYQTCKYVCDGITEMELTPEQIDHSTYNIYYANFPNSRLKTVVESKLRQYKRIRALELYDMIKDEFTKEEFLQSIFLLTEGNEDTILDYRHFMKMYGIVVCKKIIVEIEKLFQKKMSITLDEVVESLEDVSMFEILTTLSEMINNNIHIINKYGMINYIRESNNYYILVDSLVEKHTIVSHYYTLNPPLVKYRLFDDVIDEVEGVVVPRMLEELKTITEYPKFLKLFVNIPLEYRQRLLEMAVIQMTQQPNTVVNKVGEFVMKYYLAYLIETDDFYGHDIVKEDVRCFNKRGIDWRKCKPEQVAILQAKQVALKGDIKARATHGVWGLTGLADQFCLIDFRPIQEEEKRTNKIITDRRRWPKGRVCTTMNKTTLDEILKVSGYIPPDDYKINVEMDELLKLARNHNINNTVYHSNDVKLIKRHILYNGFVGTAPTVCELIKKGFAQDGLLVQDANCGTNVKSTAMIGTTTTKSTGECFMVKTDKPFDGSKALSKDEQERFNKIVKDGHSATIALEEIKKLLLNGQGTWYLFYKGNSLKVFVGGVKMINDEKIEHIIMNKTYVKEASIKFTDMMNQINTSETYTIKVDSISAEIKKFLLALGFTVVEKANGMEGTYG